MIIIPCPDPAEKTLEQIFKHYEVYFNAGRNVSDLLEKDVKIRVVVLIKKQRTKCMKQIANAGILCSEDEALEVLEETPLVKVE